MRGMAFPLNLIIAGAVFAFVFFLPAPGSALTAEEILRAVDDLWRGEQSEALITMEIVTENYRRTLSMRAWSKGTRNSLVVITYPPKDEGVATLMVEKDIWNYLPRVNRTIRVPSSMMSASWMGSHFTNDDLVKESRLSDDYDATVTFEGTRDGVSVYDILLVPRPDAAVVWGKIEFTLAADGYLPVAARYYDEEGKIARTETFGEVKVLGGRRMPTVLTLVPADKPGEKTVIRYRELDLAVKLPEGFFSLQRLSGGVKAR
jgi:hypothetical protein